MGNMPQYQPKTGTACSCRPGVQRDNCPTCEGTGRVIDFAAIRARTVPPPITTRDNQERESEDDAEEFIGRAALALVDAPVSPTGESDGEYSREGK